ncbi:MAG: glycosyltransferase [Planctomycetes bacterium]|nr:glycosyltransferase [Planctomycetota bacterium]
MSLKVSIVTPTLNAASLFERCIESVKKQSYSNLEHLICDGGSTDETITIAKEHGLKYTSEPDAGIYDAFSKGAKSTQGDIIHILNADDYYASPEVIKSIVEHMEEYNLDLCHGYVNQVTKRGDFIRRVGADISKKALLKKMSIAHPATFVRREVYERYGYFSVGFAIAGDHEFLLRIWDKINIGFLPITVSHMEWGGASSSNCIRSYRESMAATLMHGAHPIKALMRYYMECLKHKLIHTKSY